MTHPNEKPRTDYQMPIGSEASEELCALGESLRNVIDAMLRIDESHDDLTWAREQLDAVTERLRRHGCAENAVRLGVPGDPEVGRPYAFKGVFIPAHNPLAMQVDFSFEGNVLHGTTTLGVAFEGPPGCVHGGHVAALFDQILGQHNLSTGIPAMTGTLTVRFRRPTPLFTELRFEARTRSREGRKIITEGWLKAGDEVTAEAEGLFILPRKDRLLIPGHGQTDVKK
ncbi:MAG: PaaI family thioesterase [Deltaproteobacteria bacterium]|nr:MAG: PaaI family thioesterase [Deltaproteobacteria bacterium]